VCTLPKEAECKAPGQPAWGFFSGIDDRAKSKAAAWPEVTKSHAYRCLANRWLGIIWKLWQSRELYDEAYHLQQIQRHRRR